MPDAGGRGVGAAPAMAEARPPGIRRSVLVFLDGVGVGLPDALVNPTLAAELPTLDGALGGRPTLVDARLVSSSGRGASAPLDACLGVDGTPQSGTGQAALLTGTNAARAFGRHFGPWTPVALRAMVARESLLAAARRRGLAVAFANAYPEELLAAAGGPRPPMPLRAAPVIAARGADALTRTTAALAEGRAVASEITNAGWREHLGRTGLPDIDPAGAGRNLAAIVAGHDLTLFAHDSTDAAGHARDGPRAVAALERVDAFLGGLLAAVGEDVRIVVASDHGNIEDVRTGHTRNPALGLVLGPGAEAFASRLASITDVAPRMLGELGVGG